MDHIGAHHLHQNHAEPISFGIDQILNNPDQGSCMISGSRLQDSSDYGLSCIVSSAYNSMTGSYGANGGSAGAYPGACSMASLPGSYNVNMGVAMNGNSLSSAGGVIRVPAHRPLAGGAHQPLSTGMPTVPSVNPMNNLTGLTFPWMESNRRYTKDRFTGDKLQRRGRPRDSKPTVSSCSSSRRPSRKASISPSRQTPSVSTTLPSSPFRTSSLGPTTHPKSPASPPSPLLVNRAHDPVVPPLPPLPHTVLRATQAPAQREASSFPTGNYPPTWSPKSPTPSQQISSWREEGGGGGEETLPVTCGIIQIKAAFPFLSFESLHYRTMNKEELP
ncbi:T-cell leukemia homeobox protein 1 isoform 1-T3 [Pangshura tecta]